MQRIPTLDGWRALAIGAVMVHHASMGLYSQEAAYWSQSRTLAGAFGVDIFFGLSGFLITTLLLQEWDRSGSVSLGSFYIRRAFRILPPYLLLLVALTAAGSWRSRQEALGCIFFFRNYVGETLVSRSTQHLWSLAVEEHFYLIWPGLLVLAGRRRGKNVAVCLALAVGVWRMIESQAGLGWFVQVPPHFRTDLRLDALLWGGVTAFVWTSKQERLRFARQMNFGVWLAVAALSAGIATVFYSMATSVILAVLIPLVLAGTAAHPEWLAGRILEWAPLRWVGRISYSLYLWQQEFLVPAWDHPAHWWQMLPWNVVLIFAAAALSYYLVERPLLAWGRRLARSVVRRPVLVPATQEA